MDDEGIDFWIRSGHNPHDGSYIVEITVGEDTAVALTRPKALEWAADVVRIAQEAAFDAAILAQMRSVDAPDEAIGSLIHELRKQRKPSKTPPLEMVSGVSEVGKPFVSLWLNGRAAGQWEVEQAVRIGGEVLEVLAVAQLDAQYLKMLSKGGELTPMQASAIVQGLGDYRYGGPSPGDPSSSS